MHFCNICKVAGTLPAILLLLSSCSEHDFPGAQGSSSTIRFDASAVAAVSPDAATVREYDAPVAIYAPSLRDSLYLHTTVEDFDAAATHDHGRLSRGVPVSDVNFAAVCGSFSVTAYTGDDNQLYIDRAVVDRHSSGTWQPADTRYWPGDRSLDFYAIAPASLGAAITVDAAATTVAFDYTVSAGSSTDDDARQQPDVLLATATCSRTSAVDGTVSLRFAHALAAIRFEARDIAGGTINSISLRNVAASGRCTARLGSDIDWTASGSADAVCTQRFAVPMEDATAGTQPVTDIDPSTTFMMIPQTLADDAVIEVDITTADGVNHILTASVAATTWQPGKVYTYIISTESINWQYVFNISDDVTLPLGDRKGNYSVESYRYRTSNPEVREPVAWTAANRSDDERRLVEQFTYAGAGAVDAVATMPFVLKKQKMRTTWDNNEQTLRSHAHRGTVAAPYNLATRGGTQSATTSNCYVVDAAGTYCLPLVYGNAIRNGADNRSAYTDAGNVFYDYLDREITSPYIGANTALADATVVWSDAFQMFFDEHISDDGNYLVFTVDDEYLQQANAILAVRDAAGRIVWSWHIWVTERDVEATIGVGEWRSNWTNAYLLMPYNIGWIDSKEVIYDEQTVPFDFTQDRSGLRRTLSIKQTGERLDYRDGGSLYYQWGRKDPFISLRNRSHVGVNDFRPHYSPRDEYNYTYEVAQVSVGEAIQHPNVYYVSQDGKEKSDHHWVRDDQLSIFYWDNRTSRSVDDTWSVKTVYDPSPVGFKVPPSRMFEIFVNAEGLSENGEFNGYIEPSGYEYTIYTERDRQGSTFRIVATGQRSDRVEGLGGPGVLWALHGAYYWSCTAMNPGSAEYGGTDYIAFSLCLREDANTYTSQFAGAQTMARPVRPIRE